MNSNQFLIKLLFLLFLCCSTSFLRSQNLVETASLERHLQKLTQTEKARNYRNLASLNAAADYIFAELQAYTDTTYFQSYEVNGETYKNVIAVLGGARAETIVIGAHYDVCGEQAGADDNASGVVGLLELARLLTDQELPYRIELVAYTLEEPPFFRSQNMGSYVHAQSVAERGLDLYGMICLEMIGYFDEAKKSQSYPLSIFSLFYGNRGDYITLVNKFGKGKFSRKYSRKFKKVKRIKTKKFTGPKALEGIDFSDHLNYWALGYSALMITDTAFYRNKHYHEESDTIDKLDLPKMARVIESVYEALLQM